MIRIALVGDSHADINGRFDEHNRIMEWIGEDAAARGVSLFLHSGDIWERRSTSSERIAVADWVRNWTDHAPLVLVAGNHDDELDIEWLGRLRTRNPVFARTRPDVVSIGGVAVACLPWPRKANLLAATPGMSYEEADAATVEALRNVLRGLGDKVAEHGGARILLAHAMVRGSRVSHAQPPLVGGHYELGLDDLTLARAEFYALGHIHLGEGNEWDAAGAPVVYPGSPRRCTFGESEEKGYVLITFTDAGELVGWERVATPATPMILLEGRWLDGQIVGVAHPPLGHAEVRLRYQVPIDQREAARVEASAWKQRILDAGAVSVKVEEVVDAQQRARAPEVASARTLREQLEAYWARYGFEPGDRRGSLLSKLEGLESSHAH